MEEKGFHKASVGLHWEASHNHAPTSDTEPGNHGYPAFLTMFLIAQRFHYCVGYAGVLHEKRLFLPLKWLFQYWFRFEIGCWFMLGCWCARFINILCKKFKGEGIQTPLGHQAQASRSV
jgi:hypothetical protein